jgi:hypothetical protein
MCTFTLESTHLIFNKCPIYTHVGASAKFSTNSQETDYSADRLLRCEASFVNYVAVTVKKLIKTNLS